MTVRIHAILRHADIFGVRTMLSTDISFDNLSTQPALKLAP